MPWPAELTHLPVRHLRALVSCDAITDEPVDNQTSDRRSAGVWPKDQPVANDAGAIQFDEECRVAADGQRVGVRARLSVAVEGDGAGDHGQLSVGVDSVYAASRNVEADCAASRGISINNCLPQRAGSRKRVVPVVSRGSDGEDVD